METLASLGEAMVLFGESCAVWLEQWAPMLRQLNEAMEEMRRWLAPHLRTFEKGMRRPETQALIQGLAEWLALLDSAPSYCLPYDRELARLGMKPLTAEEQRDFVVFAMLLQDRKELQLGHRLPLAEIALVAGRLDITAALVMERAAVQRAIRWVERSNEQEEGELISAAYAELHQHILPNIERRLDGVALGDARRILRPKLKQVVRDAYLVKSIRRALVRLLGREARRKAKEEEWDDEAQQRLAQMRQGMANDDRDQNWDIEQAMASFPARPRDSELDRKLVAALRRWPESSAREIAGRLREPVRTVQHHYRKLIDHVRKQVES
jgi:hypothetical protein